MKYSRLIYPAVLWLFFAPLLLNATQPVSSDINFTITGNLGDPELKEISGVSPSMFSADLLWMINDSGGAPAIYAVGINGGLRGRVRINKAHNRDWEDMAAFMWSGKPYLLIADVGDNKSRHKSYKLYIVAEPRLDAWRRLGEQRTDIAWHIKFRYPDGGHDAEAVAVDGTAEKVYIITKRDQPPKVFELPLRPRPDHAAIVAKPIALMGHLPQPTADELKLPYGDKRSWPTAMAMDRTAEWAVVLTYSSAYLFQRPPGMDWAQAFAGIPRKIPLPTPEQMPTLPQREAMCLTSDGRHIVVTSEGANSALIKVNLFDAGIPE